MKETVNRKARFDYNVLEEFTAGLVLPGRSVKDVRAGRISLADTYGHFDLAGRLTVNVSAGGFTELQLLLTKRELRKIREELRKPGISLVPLRIFFSRGLAKMNVGLCRGKKAVDKRAALKEKDLSREMKYYI